MYDSERIIASNNWKKDTENFKKSSKYREKHKYYCSCGHSVIIPYFQDRKLCSWCKHWVYKDDKRFFKDKMRQLLNQKQREGE